MANNNEASEFWRSIQELDKMSLPTKLHNYEEKLSFMQCKIDDFQNRPRRSNVLFFGIKDTDIPESWDVSEELVNNVWVDKLEVNVTSVARAHRLDKFSADKKRPIIPKSFIERDLETVLSRRIK
ncbi:hypothetical protein HPB48_019883 [Haemaphysalis longicornis]|uniref:Uncharacterized protein n=1 Tax=Haemaphysalis longicornis TaxID=44386 RepID=A0A9J6GX16_HAELO|nr:hypothetical protein HPB48_019883 [Haemaphysalis longicornis]